MLRSSIKMNSLRILATVVVLLGAGCVSLTPEQKVAHQTFMEAAYQCESRYHTIHVDQIDLEGSLQIHADADSRGEYQAFVTCYHEGLRARVEARRKAGLDIPEGLTRAPEVVLD
jgi:hypothetical protein